MKWYISSSLIVCVTLLMSCTLWLKKVPEPTVRQYKNFPSAFVQSRNVEVILPPGYNPKWKYDVLYMQDGQNLYDPRTSFGGITWAIDRTTDSLIRLKKIRPVIIVGIWSTNNRFNEYMPGKPANAVSMAMNEKKTQGPNLSDAYLKFLVNELKPFIDKNFNTNPGPDHTMIMGSSMGGLISCYAMCEYPQVFGGAACLSTHWIALDGVFLQYLSHHLPDHATHKLYFDHGTTTLDSQYAPWQHKADSIAVAAGYSNARNFQSLIFEGAAHNEKYWQQRAHVPLEFLFKNS